MTTHDTPPPPSSIGLLRKLIGILIALGGLFVLAHGLIEALWEGQPHIQQALIGGGVAAAATALGTVPVLFSQQLSERLQDTLFGFGAGVMLAASAFSLVIPGLDAAEAQGAGRWGASLTVGGAILLGAALLLLMERYLPHEHFIKGLEGVPAHTRSRIRRTWLFIFAIALHNLPEGLAIGVAYAATDPVRAGALTTGISIQDIPEGLVVAVALVSIGYSRLTAVTLGILSGLVEPMAAVIGAAVVSFSSALLPWGLGLAAGAMLFVISHEIIPESHRKGHEVFATAGLMVGFVIMMVLDTALG
ncbi:Zinc transporter ZupT [Pigmentiphaga humi]|uniref:Zinc transporter ZupT n=1 Tax=Pigmentiphaga humi TaxID=2478468 RepID=A0A3P4B855_9BURK|nr:ZIP family metal transporter [Pigmentiphaga humi]VCU72454.1 Zinc transporter ZupT [Pigmentiphaga humi]